jgi:hypothetical protein
MNMFVVHANIVTFRNGYRFGGSIDDILGNPDEWETLRHVVFRNQSQGLFFPLYGQQIIAHTCRNMLSKYKVLGSVHEKIGVVADLDAWSKQPQDRFDNLFMELRRKNVRGFTT